MDIKNTLKEMINDYKKPLIICGGFIALLIIFFIVVGVIKGLKKSYTEIEDKMKNAAISYYEKYEEKLPKTEGAEVSIKAQTLIDNEMMKPLEKYVRNDEVTCDGKVIVTKTYKNYLYTPVLDCGKEYKTKMLSEELTKKIVDSGNGLYAGVGEYYYRGEYVNNYVKIGEKLWRVLSIKEDGTMTIVQNNPDKNKYYVYDDRYNNESEGNDGFNNYEKSRLRDSMLKLYKGTSVLDAEQKKVILSDNLCIGTRSLEEVNNDGSVECATKTINKYPFRLLQANEFLRASLDSSCQKIEDGVCSNYNYLVFKDFDYWLMTPSPERTYRTYILSNAIDDTTTSNEKRVRIVVNISKNTTFSSGRGTVKNPYIINY